VIGLDNLDQRLLVLLTRDASRTNTAMARELGVADNTVRNRIQRLIDEGIVQITAIVDWTKVGHRIQIISGIEVELDKIHDVVNELASLPEVSYASYTSGEYDIIVVAVFRDQEELFCFLTKRIPMIAGIRRIRTNQVLKAVKRTFQYQKMLLDGNQTNSEIGTDADALAMKPPD
jgi:Lrp/AsnC family transcriptional regulator, regulator for asnA, asnC and gidA